MPSVSADDDPGLLAAAELDFPLPFALDRPGRGDRFSVDLKLSHESEDWSRCLRLTPNRDAGLPSLASPSRLVSRLGFARTGGLSASASLILHLVTLSVALSACGDSDPSPAPCCESCTAELGNFCGLTLAKSAFRLALGEGIGF